MIDPKKIVVKEVETQTELSDEEVKEKNDQINQLSQEIEGLETERDNLKEKYNQLRINISNILYPEIEGAVLADSDRELVSQDEMIIKRLNDLKAELDVEKGWWDKWVTDENFYFLSIDHHCNSFSSYYDVWPLYIRYAKNIQGGSYWNVKEDLEKTEIQKKLKLTVKEHYEYYKNK